MTSRLLRYKGSQPGSLHMVLLNATKNVLLVVEGAVILTAITALVYSPHLPIQGVVVTLSLSAVKWTTLADFTCDITFPLTRPLSRLHHQIVNDITCLPRQRQLLSSFFSACPAIPQWRQRRKCQCRSSTCRRRSEPESITTYSKAS
jgi:hypothetical protein